MFTSGRGLVLGAVGLAAVGLLALLSPIAGTSFAQAPTATATPAPGSSWSAYGEYFIQQFAARLGVTVEKLKDAYLGAFNDTVDKAVQDDALTQTQAERLKERAANRVADGRWPGFWDGPAGRGGRRGGGPGIGPWGGMMGGCEPPLMEIVAEKLGLKVSELTAQLRDGKTIADIAAEHGVALDTIADAVIAAHKECLDQAVKDGRLTQTQADKMLEQMKSRITDLLQNSFPPPAAGPFGPRCGPGSGGGGRGGRWWNGGNQPDDTP